MAATKVNSLDEDYAKFTSYLSSLQDKLAQTSSLVYTRQEATYRRLRTDTERLLIKVHEHEEKLKSVIAKQREEVDSTQRQLSESVKKSQSEVANTVESYKQMCLSDNLDGFDPVHQTNNVKELMQKISQEMNNALRNFVQRGNCEYVAKTGVQRVEELLETEVGYIRTLALTPDDVRVQCDEPLNFSTSELTAWIKCTGASQPRAEVMGTVHAELKIAVNQIGGTQVACNSAIVDRDIKVTFTAEPNKVYSLEVKLYGEHVNGSPLMVSPTVIRTSNGPVSNGMMDDVTNGVARMSTTLNRANLPLPLSLHQNGHADDFVRAVPLSVQPLQPTRISPIVSNLETVDDLMTMDDSVVTTPAQNGLTHQFDSLESEAIGFSAGVSEAAGPVPSRRIPVFDAPTVNDERMSTGMSEADGLVATSKYYGQKVGGGTMNSKFRKLGGDGTSKAPNNYEDLTITVANEEHRNERDREMVSTSAAAVRSTNDSSGSGDSHSDALMQPALMRPDLTCMISCSATRSSGDTYAIAANRVAVFGHRFCNNDPENDLFLPIGCEKNEKMGYFVVCDTRHNLVKAYKMNGDVKFIIREDRNVRFARPSAVQCFNDGSFCVKDDVSIQHFDRRGKFIRKFGEDMISKQGRAFYGLAITESGHLLTLEVSRRGAFQPLLHEFDYQRGILVQSHQFECVDGEDRGQSKCRFMDAYGSRLVVADLGMSCAYVSTMNGQLLRKFAHRTNSDGRRETMAGTVYEPSGVTIDPAGNVFLGDSRNDRVQIYSTSGDWKGLVKFSHPIRRPSGISLTNDGHLVVSNYIEHYVGVYKLEKL